jgi:subtilisin family serine protease
MTKLDAELLHQLALLKAGAGVSGTKHPVRVLIRYTGGLDAIQAHGFTVESILPGNIAAGSVDLASLEQLAALDNVVYIEGERFQRLHLKDSVPEINAPKVWTGNPTITGKGVVVGIVDTGIDIFHHSFSNPDGTTRILFIWDQTLTPQGTEKSPPDMQGGVPLFPGGVEFSATDINAALKTPNVAFRHADVSKHGTHVAGTAAGNGSQSGNCSGANTYVGVAPNASLIIVKSITDDKEYAIIPTQAPYTVTVNNANRFQRNRQVDYYNQEGSLTLVTSNPGKGEYSVAAGVYTFNAADAGAGVLIIYDYNQAQPGSSSSVDTAKAVQYIFQRAQTAGMPAAVNLSFGGSIGPHDGTSNQETTLDGNITAQNGRVIVISAGNEADQNKHASGTIPANQPFPLALTIPSNDNQPDYIDIWYPGPGTLSVSVTSPSGTTPVVAPGAPAATPTVGTDQITISSSLNIATNNKNRIFLTIVPTAAGVVPPPAPGTTPPLPAITTGSWTLNLQETAGSAVAFDAWIHNPHDDPSPYFTNPDKAKTITPPATALNAVAVGAYNPRDSNLAPFSSWGPTADGRLKPDICAPGMGIFAPKAGKRNLGCCCDCCENFYRPDEGTSMAAPHVTGVAALMLQRDPTLSYRIVRNQIQVTGRSPDPITGPTLPNSNWGYGKVDALGAVNSLSILNPLPNGGPKKLGVVAGGGRAGARAHERAMTFPLAAMWLTYQPTRERLQRLSTLLHTDPVGQLLAGLVSTHFDEVYRLVNGNKKAASRWHRMQGPMMLSEIMRSVEEDRDLLLPATIAGSPVSEGLSGMFEIFLRYGSPLLKADAIRYRYLFLALPGRPIRELSQLQQPRIEDGYADRHSRTHCA